MLLFTTGFVSLRTFKSSVGMSTSLFVKLIIKPFSINTLLKSSNKFRNVFLATSNIYPCASVNSKGVKSVVLRYIPKIFVILSIMLYFV